MMQQSRTTTWALAGLFALGSLATTAAKADKVHPFKVNFVTSKGEPAGVAKISEDKSGGVKIKLEFKNLPPGQHGVHIHENATCTAPDFKSAGGHFNPTGKHHGFENPMGHHAGDTPSNVVIGDNHSGEATFILSDVTLDPLAPNSLFAHGGTSIVVHASGDDMKSDPAGNAGARIACAVVVQP
ncbi:MAG: superoxide dismutase family protein [Acidobacteriaceae bacterium]|nr:superoxide dismutase family protein [Acidobacteriaceae bacterium]